tara:strand:+ start:15106 stop:15483 length:378 start_codon:yes stop_codon:yes gene_type:complete
MTTQFENLNYSKEEKKVENISKLNHRLAISYSYSDKDVRLRANTNIQSENSFVMITVDEKILDPIKILFKEVVPGQETELHILDRSCEHTDVILMPYFEASELLEFLAKDEFNQAIRTIVASHQD